MLVVPSQKQQPQWLTRPLASLAGTAMFVAPLAALVLLWAIVVPLFGINPRIFPSVSAVAGAAMQRSFISEAAAPQAPMTALRRQSQD